MTDVSQHSRDTTLTAPSPAYRLPDRTRIGVARLQISDLERSLAFYSDLLGLQILERSASSAALGPHGASTRLIELHERRGVRPVPREGRLGLFHVAILLPERNALGRFARHALNAGVPIGSADHLVSEAFYLSDPDGLGIEVYADRPGSTWRIEGGEIAMATLTLDVRGLVDAAGDAPWTGATDGTTIGHVHLSVGSLPAADAFYHAALGLDRTVWSYPGALFLSAGGYHHHLGLNTWSPSARPATDEDARLLDWEIVLPSDGDVEAAAARLSAAGVLVDSRDGARVAADPWGTTLRITHDLMANG